MDNLEIASDALRVKLLRRGATLAGVYHHRREARNLVLGFADPTDHLRIPVYAGALVGPVANRVRNGYVRIGQDVYHMARNENDQTALHSGPGGLHARNWTVVDHQKDSLSFQCLLAHGDCGLPGVRKIVARYRVIGSLLELEITATTNHATPMNIAAHPYWNLDGTLTLKDHRLQLSANRFLPTTAQSLPTGQINPARGTVFDFSVSKPIAPTPEIDVNYCLSPAPAPEPRHAATLIGGSRMQLDLATTAPGLQVYNGAHLPQLPNVLTEKRDLAPYGAIALEPQHWPDALYHPHFPDIILSPGQTYRQLSRYTLSHPQEES